MKKKKGKIKKSYEVKPFKPNEFPCNFFFFLQRADPNLDATKSTFLYASNTILKESNEDERERE